MKFTTVNLIKSSLTVVAFTISALSVSNVGAFTTGGSSRDSEFDKTTVVNLHTALRHQSSATNTQHVRFGGVIHLIGNNKRVYAIFTDRCGKESRDCQNQKKYKETKKFYDAMTLISRTQSWHHYIGLEPLNLGMTNSRFELNRHEINTRDKLQLAGRAELMRNNQHGFYYQEKGISLKREMPFSSTYFTMRF
ncbi:hypothetical protein ACSLBF_01950 [Pseudoalteromonas sp. T1lg65]|uniref:hypothetical protein n=1 Tax=Pseudoalteromonas sp. T1lg65 TaxID=2077101 RepID=UPI003F79A26C